MRSRWAFFPAWVLVLCGVAWGQATRETTAPPDVPAAQSLLHSAQGLVHLGNDLTAAAFVEPPARAVRLVALGRFAQSLAPDDPQIGWLMAGIYQSQARPKPAADALAVYGKAHPEDMAAATRWMALSLEALNGADQRLALLESLLKNEQYKPAFWAQCALRMAQIYAGQGLTDKQLDSCRLAVTMDPHDPDALNAVLAATKKPTAVQRAQTLVRLIEGNPLAANAVWDLATLADSVGLHALSIRLFDAAWQVDRQYHSQQPVSAAFMVQYFSAMLDDGDARRAANLFAPLLSDYDQVNDFLSLLIEAYRAAGEGEKAQQLVRQMEVTYKRSFTAGSAPTNLTAELAWFYLVTRKENDLALKYARSVPAEQQSNPTIARIVAACELMAGKQPAKPEAVLRAMMASDAYADAILAEYYYAKGDTEKADKAVRAGLELVHGGPAYRKLADLAKEHTLLISVVKEQAEVRRVIETLDRRCLEMALAPEKFVEIKMAAPESLEPGQPLTVEATLINKGEVELPLGTWGLLNPTMNLDVTVKGPDGEHKFTNLPPVLWPAPRSLAPGKSVTASVRYDVGGLAAYLARHPLDPMNIFISGMLSPVPKGSSAAPLLPGVPTPVVRTVRLSMLETAQKPVTDPPAAYRLLLGTIVRDSIRGGDVEARMRGARQVGSLLALARSIETRKAIAPEALKDAVTKPVLLSMTKALLQDPDPRVRAEMIVALQDVDLDDFTISLLAPRIEDASALVRLRLAELLGATGQPSQKPVLELLAKDSDERVRLMAQGFLKQK